MTNLGLGWPICAAKPRFVTTALGMALAKKVAREAEAALGTARAKAEAMLRAALGRMRHGASECEQRAARDLDEMTSSSSR